MTTEADTFLEIMREHPPVMGQPLPTGLNDFMPGMNGVSRILYMTIAELVERVQALEEIIKGS